MKMAVPLLLAVLAASTSGCTYVRGKVAEMSDEELSLKIHDGAEAAVNYGVKFLVNKYPEKKDAIMKDVLLASTIVKTNVLPVFADASSVEVLSSAIGTALDAFKGKISPELEAAIRLGFAVVSSKIEIPKVPTEKLSPRLRGAVLAFFTGTSEGLDDLLPPPVPIPPPPR